MTSSGIHILLVEDSPTDRFLATRALQRTGVACAVDHVEDGVEAMLYLRRQGKFAACRRPDLILLDLNLPRKDGREVLSELKSDPALLTIPVVVLTTSQAAEDVAYAYQHHCNSYLKKSGDFADFVKALKALMAYWFDVVTLPIG